jgi:hypothetical protein
VALVLQHQIQQAPDERIVVDDEDPQRGHGTPLRGP